MKELKVNGKQNFMGIDIPIIEGGFGEDKRVTTAKTVSEIHKVELKNINRYIKRLIDGGRCKKNIDYIDLLAD